MSYYIWLAVATVVGFAAGSLVTRMLVNKLVAEARDALRELDDTAWSLGGRLRTREQPPVYLTPPGHPVKKVASCDEARVLWLDHCMAQAEILRDEGHTEAALRLYPLTAAAEQ